VELQRELDDLGQRLDEAGGATQAQVNIRHYTLLQIRNLGGWVISMDDKLLYLI